MLSVKTRRLSRQDRSLLKAKTRRKGKRAAIRLVEKSSDFWDKMWKVVGSEDISAYEIAVNLFNQWRYEARHRIYTARNTPAPVLWSSRENSLRG